MLRARLLLSLLLLTAFSAQAEKRVVRRYTSHFGPLFVVDEGGERFLRFGADDAADQSVIDLNDPRAAPVAYVRAATLGAAWPAEVRRAVVVGMGAGVLSRALLAAAPNARLHSVELDPLVVKLARELFGLKRHARHFVHVDDGARFIERVHRADLIILDAYQGNDLPAALSSPAFFARVRAATAPGGVAILNLAVEDPALEDRLVQRFRASFPHCEALRVSEGNLLLFGAARGSPELRRRAREEIDTHRRPSLAARAPRAKAHAL